MSKEITPKEQLKSIQDMLMVFTGGTFESRFKKVDKALDKLSELEKRDTPMKVVIENKIKQYQDDYNSLVRLNSTFGAIQIQAFIEFLQSLLKGNE